MMKVIIKFTDEDAASDAQIALDGWKYINKIAYNKGVHEEQVNDLDENEYSFSQCIGHDSSILNISMAGSGKTHKIMEILNELRKNENNSYYICRLMVGESNDNYERPIPFKINMKPAITRLYLEDGEVRDKNGNYIGFVPDTINAFTKCGMKFYNEAILLNAIASASMRANGNMKSKKLVKVHQNILIFKK